MELNAATKSEILFWMKDYDFKKWVDSLDKRFEEFKKKEKQKLLSVPTVK